jgi:predicted hotdog family 3-hydroxylacyl-ACP dehydratase
MATAELAGALPHRPPMVWIDQVTALRADGGDCGLTLKPDGLYLGPQGLRRSSLIELIAQAYGFVCAARSVSGANAGGAHSAGSGAAGASAPRRAFLAAIRNAEFFAPVDPALLQPGARLRISVSGERQMGPISMFDGQVHDQAGGLLARASLKVFSE